jgi:hypothetical protein
MAVEYGPRVANEGLVFAFDSASNFSYGGSGTTVNGLAIGVDASLVNGTDHQGYSLAVENSGGYMMLDGTNDYIQTNDITLDSNRITVDCFVRAGTATTAQVLFEFSSNYTAVNDGFLVSYYDTYSGITSDLLIAREGDDGKNMRAYSKGLLPSGSWRHLCVQFDETQLVPSRNILYINAEKQSPSQPQSGHNADNSGTNFGTHKLFIGGRDTAIGPFLGDVASLRVYNRLLSEDEIRSNYLALKNRFGL